MMRVRVLFIESSAIFHDALRGRRLMANSCFGRRRAPRAMRATVWRMVEKIRGVLERDEVRVKYSETAVPMKIRMKVIRGLPVKVKARDCIKAGRAVSLKRKVNWARVWRDKMALLAIMLDKIALLIF